MLKPLICLSILLAVYVSPSQADDDQGPESSRNGRTLFGKKQWLHDLKAAKLDHFRAGPFYPLSYRETRFGLPLYPVRRVYHYPTTFLSKRSVHDDDDEQQQEDEPGQQREGRTLFFKKQLLAAKKQAKLDHFQSKLHHKSFPVWQARYPVQRVVYYPHSVSKRSTNDEEQPEDKGTREEKTLFLKKQKLFGLKQAKLDHFRTKVYHKSSPWEVASRSPVYLYPTSHTFKHVNKRSTNLDDDENTSQVNKRHLGFSHELRLYPSWKSYDDFYYGNRHTFYPTRGFYYRRRPSFFGFY